MDSLEKIVSTSNLVRKYWLPLDLAIKQVIQFEHDFGRAHLALACHAALPSIITPELVNLIRINFLETVVEWVAESDLLLSSLCNPIGEAIFEIEPQIREVLLFELKHNPIYGSERLEALAMLLRDYTEAQSTKKLSTALKRTYRWIADAYLAPDAVVSDMFDLLNGIKPEERLAKLATQVQMGKTLELLAGPLEQTNLQVELEDLVSSTRILAYYWYEDRKALASTLQSSENSVDEISNVLANSIARWIITAEEASGAARVSTVSKKVEEVLPSSIDLRPKCPPVYDAGTLGGVVANAIAAALEFCLMQQHLFPIFTPSRLFMYYNERVIEGTVDSDSGSQIADGVKSVETQGVCPEEMWPYDIAKFAERPPDACYQAALQYRIFRFKRVRRNLVQLKKCLASGDPFIFGFSVYMSFQSQQVTETGHAPLPQPGELVIGGHAALAVGYDDANQWFIVQNSWGTAWGMQGYFTLPYAYFTNSKLTRDFWTARIDAPKDKKPSTRSQGAKEKRETTTSPSTQSFRPLPPPTGKPPYHLSLGDVLPPEQMQTIRSSGRLVFHIIGSTGGVKAPQSQQIVASKMLEDFKASDPTARPSFFYILGDVIFYYGEAENYYAQFYEPYRAYPAPIFAIPGNHDGDVSEPYRAYPAPIFAIPDNHDGEVIDHSKTSLEAFVRNFCAPEPHYTAEAGNVSRSAMTQPNVYWTLDTPFVTIIGLYSNVTEGGRLDDQQIAWFESELANAPKDKALIVTMHHPVYSADTKHSGSRYMGQMLDQAVQKAGRMPDAVFAGHVHNYQRFTRPVSNGEVPYIAAATGGYFNLHAMMKENGVSLQTPYRMPETDVTLESYCDDRHGFMRVEITAQVLKGEYYAVPRPNEPSSNPAELRDSFTLDLQAHRVSSGSAGTEHTDSTRTPS